MPMPTSRFTLLSAVMLPFLLAGCDATGLKLPGFGDRASDATPAPAGPPAVSPLDVPIETGQAVTPLGTANRATAGVAAFAARGADWSAVVDGKAAALTRPGAKPVRISVRRIDFGGGVEFVGSLGGRAFALTVRAADCADGSPLSATVKYSGKSLAGCATAATADQVKTIAAAAAAPAPKKPAAPKPTAPKPAPAPEPAAAEPVAAGTQTPEPATPPVTTPPVTPPAATTPAAATPDAATPDVTTPVPTPAQPVTTPPETSTPATPSATTPPIIIPGGPTTLPAAPVATTPAPAASQ